MTPIPNGPSGKRDWSLHMDKPLHLTTDDTIREDLQASLLLSLSDRLTTLIDVVKLLSDRVDLLAEASEELTHADEEMTRLISGMLRVMRAVTDRAMANMDREEGAHSWRQ